MAPGAAARSEPVFKFGKRGIEVPMKLHSLNRERLCNRIAAVWAAGGAPTNSLDGVYILLQGGSNVFRGDADMEMSFRQESFFHWTFGGLEPDWYGAIEVKTKKVMLFIPRVSENAAVYMGETASLGDIKMQYDVEETHFCHDIDKVFVEKKPSVILTLHGLNTDSGRYTLEAHFNGIEKFNVNNTILHHEIAELRVIKTELELEVLRYSILTSSAAHRHLMRKVKPGMFQYQAESIFEHYCYYYGGMRHCGYTCIAASGCDCAVLHYGHAGAPNEREILDGDMCLFDMGGEYYCYTSDITCSYPVNGKFTPDQRLIYEAVYCAVQAVLTRLRPGVSWLEMHRQSERALLIHLTKGGLLKGDIDEMMEARMGAVFLPCGMGHLMGCDVHEVGGYNKGAPIRPTEPGVKNLRTARVIEANMVITVEPGVYFIKMLIDQAKASPKQNKFLVPAVLDRFLKFGGVRIEEDVLVTENGCEVLNDVPRTVAEIEDWMAREHTEFDEMD